MTLKVSDDKRQMNDRGKNQEAAVEGELGVKTLPFICVYRAPKP